MLLGNKFEEALVYATQLHSRQLRKGTAIPYVSHLLGVTSIALEHGADEDEAIAALLHDAVEDQGGQPTLEEIRNRFGERVAGIVLDCSDTDTIPKPPWQERKRAYISHLAGANNSVVLISASDKLHNARSILADLREHGHGVFEKFRGGKSGTLWYYRELVTTFRQLPAPARLIDELERVVVEMERLAG